MDGWIRYFPYLLTFFITMFKELSRIIDQAPDLVAEPADDSDDELKVKQKYVKYDVEASKLDSSGLYYKDSDSELEMESDSDTDKEKDSLGKYEKNNHR